MPRISMEGEKLTATHAMDGRLGTLEPNLPCIATGLLEQAALPELEAELNWTG